MDYYPGVYGTDYSGIAMIITSFATFISIIGGFWWQYVQFNRQNEKLVNLQTTTDGLSDKRAAAAEKLGFAQGEASAGAETADVVVAKAAETADVVVAKATETAAEVIAKAVLAAEAIISKAVLAAEAIIDKALLDAKEGRKRNVATVKSRG